MDNGCAIGDFNILQTASVPPDKYSYGTRMLDVIREWKTTQGETMNVAVPDTGIDKIHATTGDLKHITSIQDFVGSDGYDRNGHGTWCLASIGARGRMVGAAPKVNLHSLKVMKDDGRGNFRDTMRAFRWCIDNKMDVVSLSLGGGMDLGLQKEFRALLDEMLAAGIIIIAAAGNMGHVFPDQDTVIFPAAFEQVVAVVSVNIAGIKSYYSSAGPAAELALAGEQVWSCGLNGGYLQASGTSMAAPAGAAAAAIIKRQEYLRFGEVMTPHAIRRSMARRAEDLGVTGRDRDYGYGLFSFGRFDNFAELKVDMHTKKVYANGRELTPDVPPQLVNGRTLLEVRTIAEALGLKNISWDGRYSTFSNY